MKKSTLLISSLVLSTVLVFGQSARKAAPITKLTQLNTIDEQVEKIKKALETLGVAHGHTHENNFIVYFDRDEQGEPILEKPPKVYVIDFDRAVSSQNN